MGLNITHNLIFIFTKEVYSLVYSSVFLKEYTWFVYSREYSGIHLEYTYILCILPPRFWACVFWMCILGVFGVFCILSILGVFQNVFE